MGTMTSRRASLSIILLIVGLVNTTNGGAAAGAAPTQNASFVLDWYPNSDHGGLFTAVSRGYFRRNHIDATVHVPSDTTAQIQLVAAGKADFGITYETDLLAARAHHVPVRSVM